MENSICQFTNNRIQSAMPAVTWPSLPSATSATLLSVLYQLESSQWWDKKKLEKFQFEQLGQLIQHAYSQSPWYKEKLTVAGYHPGMIVEPEWWKSLPILSRTDLQDHFDQLKAKEVPDGHTEIQKVHTSGSTGKPAQALNSNITRFIGQVQILRDHFWHQRDFSQKFIAIRPDRLNPDQKQASADNWGIPVSAIFDTGPCMVINSNVDIQEQLDILADERPGYLLTVPENMRALAKLSLERGERLEGLRQARSYGGVVLPELKTFVKSAWGVSLVDMYSSVEAGYFALQCPLYDHYHVQSEGVFLEVLNDKGFACKPGEIGRVVVTPLHNFATPLIRYELGDYAEVGELCSCGRGLPVLKRILGRIRNMLVTPDGLEYWPSFPAEDWSKIANIRQLQLTQDKIDHIQVTVAIENNLSVEQENRLREVLIRSLRYPFSLTFNYVSEIPLKPNHKFEDFISLVVK